MKNPNEETNYMAEGAQNVQNEENKSKATVISAAAGVVGGVAAGVAGAALWPADAQAAEGEVLDADDLLVEKAEAPTVQPEVVHHTHVEHVNVVHVNEGPQGVVPEMEVSEYQQIVDAHGTHIADVATVEMGGEQVHIFDTDVNGEADVAWYDANRNQMIDEGEVIDVSQEHIQMNGLQNMAQHTSVSVYDEAPVDTVDPGVDYTASVDTHDMSSVDMGTDMPDYVNDADVDAFVG